jgi:type II secretory pathway component PulF
VDGRGLLTPSSVAPRHLLPEGEGIEREIYMDGKLESSNDILSTIILWGKKLQFGKKAQLAFLEDLATLVNDGIPPNRAIEMMTRVTQGIARDVAMMLSLKISQGQPLAEGMRGWFDINAVEIIRVGEEGGVLNETIKSAIKTLTQQAGILGGLIGAISYPLVVMGVACGIIVYLDNSVFIQFKQMKPLDQWPQAGIDLLNTADLIESWWWLFLVVIVAAIIIFRRAMNNYTGEFRPILDKIPPFSLYRRYVAARFMETLGVLVANGVVFKQALKVIQYQAGPYLASHLVRMEQLLSAGRGNIAYVLETGLIDEEDVLRLRVMAEVKGLEHGLVRMGVRGSANINATIKTVAKVFGGLLLATDGALIIVIIRGIYLTGMSMGATS